MDEQTEVGERLPEMHVALTPAVVLATGVADIDLPAGCPGDGAARAGEPIFLSMVTTMGLVERYVTEWAGPEALIRGINVKLGVPAYAGDRLILTGRVTRRHEGEYTVTVRGRVGRGTHATGTVRFRLLPVTTA